MKHSLFVYAAFSALFLLFTACDKEYGNKSNERKDILLTKSQEEFVQGNNVFAMELFRNLSRSGHSEVFSPLSLQVLLGAMNNGLTGSASAELCDGLGFSGASSEDINDYSKSLISQLKKADRQVEFGSGNIVLLNTRLVPGGLKRGFKESMEKYYDAKVEEFDFFSDTKHLDKVNSWSKDHTDGMIPTIVDRIDPNTLLLLANAIFFEGRWSTPFNKAATRDEYFVSAGGTSVAVPMMHTSMTYNHYDGGSYSSVTLPYGNGAFAMTVILPKTQDGLGSFVSDCLGECWRDILAAQREVKVDLSMPRFSTGSRFPADVLIPALREMGIEELFAGCDLSKIAEMAGNVGDINQNARIEVSEEGTKASAVSSLSVMPTAPIVETVTFRADHPFVYIISETSTNTIVFVGQYCGD